MKKIFISLSVILISFFACDLVAFSNGSNSDIGGAEGGSVGSTSSYSDGGYAKTTDIGVRVTIYDEDGNRVSNSVDVVFGEYVYTTLISRGNAYQTTGNNGKIDYLKNGVSPKWTDTEKSLNILQANNNSKSYTDLSKSFGYIPGVYLKENVQWWADNYDRGDFPSNVETALNICKGSCTADKEYYAVMEPTMFVYASNKAYYGTVYELAEKFMSNNNPASFISGAGKLYSHINGGLPRSLTISGVYTTFYNNIGITDFCENSDTCFSISGSESHSMTKSSVLTKGVGMAVYDWTKNMPNLLEDKTCSVNVNISECGESSIYEANADNVNNNKECIVDNAAYSYIAGCNLYCSDEITTDFSGFYGNFRGNNALNAIKSGKYLAIKSNPKITIKKTCYQSSTSNECSDVSGSFRNQLYSDYQTNKIYLNVDGKKYEFVGNSTITNEGYSSATITYEYKLDDNINKYIDIETMKGILNPSNYNKVYDNGGPMIITSKGYYGSYTYNFDVSETVLNKYASSSKYLTNLKNSQSTKYNFNNTISIGYTKKDNTTTDTYTTDNLKDTTCSYVKYNSDTSCICKENSCCDSVTCEEVTCPPDTDGSRCTCTGKYGCYDDGKCTPIKDPTNNPQNNNSDSCDPEEKTCFPNLIYRPISLTNPFPGISGNGRTPGSNWNKIYTRSDGKGISYSAYYITSRRGYKDYEIYQAEPLYVIKLDGDKIQAIRKYNDKHNYNDFELTCVNGENCISKFLRGQTQDFSINLIDSGTCKNINNYNFNSCIKNKGE